MGKHQHVVKRGSDWAVRGEGNSRDTSHHDTQKEAIDAAKEIAQRERSDVIVHDRDGKFRERNSYGNDPFPLKADTSLLRIRDEGARMKFTYYDLGYRHRGDVAEVTLSGSAANVRLLDSSNFSSFKAGRPHRYIGGLAKRSPVRLSIPSAGHWYVTVDLQGLRGTTRSAIRVIPAEALSPLPEIKQRPLAPLVRQVAQEDETPGTEATQADSYDVFICHATEDKADIVRDLANRLLQQGLRVWFDEFELRIGDSLRRKIDHGLAHSRFGVVVLSPSFFAKNWPQYELDGLVTREMSGEQIILPIWHQVSRQEVASYSPSLADKLARSTADFSIEQICIEIAEVIREAMQSGVS